MYDVLWCVSNRWQPFEGNRYDMCTCAREAQIKRLLTLTLYDLCKKKEKKKERKEIGGVELQSTHRRG